MAPQVADAAAPCFPASYALRAAPRRRPASAPISTAAQYEMDMDAVQQYIRQHVQQEDASFLPSVTDARSRQCYAEIQTFLVRKLQLEKARAVQQAAVSRVTTPSTADRGLLRNLDEYLNELDPALFADGSTPMGSRVAPAVDAPVGGGYYIRRKQEDAKVGGYGCLRSCPSSEMLAPSAAPRCAGAFKRMHSL